MRIAVVGAGAVGSLFGAGLARAGHSVLLVGRPALVAAVRDRGLLVLGSGEAVYHLDATSQIEFREPYPEAALLTVKTFDLESAAESVARALPRPVPLLLPQNGLGVERKASAALVRGGWNDPAPWSVRAVHSVPATLVAPGVVRVAGSGEVVLPDPAAAGPSTPRIELFRDLLRAAGFTVRTPPDFEREVWRKALVNAAINPLTAVLGVRNGELLIGETRTRALLLLTEARRAAQAAGFTFSEEEVVADFERVARATAQNRSSMLQDLDRGRPTEIEAISGEILRVASEHGIDIPATRVIVDEVRRRVEERSRGPQPS